MLKQTKAIAKLDGAATVERQRMSYKAFLRRDDADGRHEEWVKGEVTAMAPVSNDHSAEQVFLVTILNLFASAFDLGEIRSEPFQMKTGAGLPGRSPDVLFVAKRNVARLKKTHLQGPADLVVEIMSPGTQSVDRGAKHYEYEKGGVREYWLIDPLRKRAEFYVLGKDGVYHLGQIVDGVYRSTVMPGLWIEVAWLWKRPLPSVLDVVRAWKL